MKLIKKLQTILAMSAILSVLAGCTASIKIPPPDNSSSNSSSSSSHSH